MNKRLSTHQKELLLEMLENDACRLELYVSGEQKGRWEYYHPNGPGGILRSTGNILLKGGYLEECEAHPRSHSVIGAEQKVHYRPKTGMRVK